ncbi:MAG: glycosyltransferase [Micrococcales bacterium]|nr:glycosyltransferase [Micrococcales bacterium]
MIVHLGDIAGTSRSLVQLARNDGLDWVLRDVPAGRGRPVIRVLSDRAGDLARVLRIRGRLELLHINYGVSGYYGWGAKVPVVLHLHGTDVRQDLQGRWTGPVVRRSIRSADAVLVATRDILPAVTALRADAQWFASPLPIGAFGPVPEISARARAQRRTTVFFASRWDPTKGSAELLDAAGELAARHPDWDVLGLDWGVDAPEARRRGVRLMPFLTPPDLRASMDRADVVVGQVRLGELGLTDLEAMVRRRPVIARCAASHFDGECVPVWNTLDASIVEHAEAIVAAGPDDRAVRERTERARDWVRRHHHPLDLFDRLKRIYAGLGVDLRH